MLLILFLFLFALIIIFTERKIEKIMRENGVNVYSEYEIRYYKDMFMYNRFKKFIRESNLSPAEKFEYNRLYKIALGLRISFTILFVFLVILGLIEGFKYHS